MDTDLRLVVLCEVTVCPKLAVRSRLKLPDTVFCLFVLLLLFVVVFFGVGFILLLM